MINAIQLQPTRKYLQLERLNPPVGKSELKTYSFSASILSGDQISKFREGKMNCTILLEPVELPPGLAERLNHGPHLPIAVMALDVKGDGAHCWYSHFRLGGAIRYSVELEVAKNLGADLAVRNINAEGQALFSLELWKEHLTGQIATLER